jgi:hypothetical protein
MARPRIQRAPQPRARAHPRADTRAPAATTGAAFAVLVLTVLATAAKLAYLASLHGLGASFWSRPF